MFYHQLLCNDVSCLYWNSLRWLVLATPYVEGAAALWTCDREEGWGQFLCWSFYGRPCEPCPHHWKIYKLSSWCGSLIPSSFAFFSELSLQGSLWKMRDPSLIPSADWTLSTFRITSLEMRRSTPRVLRWQFLGPNKRTLFFFFNLSIIICTGNGFPPNIINS